MEITVQPASSSMAPRALPSLLEMKAHEGDRINGSECCAGVRHTGDQLRFSCDCAAGTILHRPSARALQPHRHNPYIPFTLFSIPSILLFFNIVILLLHLTIVCFYAGNFYRCCLMYFFFFFFKFLSFGSVWFIDFQFLIFFSWYSFLYPSNTIWMACAL